MGEILENNAVVFTAELTDGQGRRVEPDEELLWAGHAQPLRARRWRRGRGDIQLGSPPAFQRIDGPTITQHIRMEETSENVIFALRPIIEIRVHPDGLIGMNSADGTLVRDADRRMRRPIGVRSGNGPLEYVVVSFGDSGTGVPIQPGENGSMTSEGMHQRYLQIPEDLDEPLLELTRRIVSGIAPGDARAKAQALERYLRDSGDFHYTLQQQGGPEHRPDPRLRGEHRARPLRIFRQRPGDDAAQPADPLPDRQRLQGGRLERPGPGPDRPATTRAQLGRGLPRLDRGRRPLPVWLPLDAVPPAERDEQVERVSRLPPATSASSPTRCATSGSSTSPASTASARNSCSTGRSAPWSATPAPASA